MQGYKHLVNEKSHRQELVAGGMKDYVLNGKLYSVFLPAKNSFGFQLSSKPFRLLVGMLVTSGKCMVNIHSEKDSAYEHCCEIHLKNFLR
jgi:hypothetical protein